VVGCSLLERTATITQSEELTGTITNGDADVDGRKSKAYQVDVHKGVEYFIRLIRDDDETVNVWSPAANAFLLEVNSEVYAHTAAYKFSETGSRPISAQPRHRCPAKLHAEDVVTSWLDVF